jgi:hypothetical protein
MDPLYWRLVYADGRVVTEPPENASIRESPPGAVRLEAVRPDGTPVAAVALWEDGRAYRPVWYRRRGLVLNSAPHPAGLETALLATVFGRARDDDAVISGTLWAAYGGRIVPCPEALIDAAAIELCVCNTTRDGLATPVRFLWPLPAK